MKKILTILTVCLLLVTLLPNITTANNECNIELTTTDMMFFVKQGTQSSQNLGVYNRGTGTLMFSLSKTYQDNAPTKINKPGFRVDHGIPELKLSTPQIFPMKNLTPFKKGSVDKPNNSNSTYAAHGKMMVDPPYLDFGTVPNSGRLTRTITCTVSGEEYLQVTATPDQGWITCQTRSIKQDIVTVLVTVELKDLVSGQLYRGNVVLSSNAGMVTIPVLLQVTTSNIRDWLKFDPASGMIDAGKSTASVVMVDAGTMKPGTYHATIVVTSNDPDQPIIQVAVKMTVIAAAPPPEEIQTFMAFPGNNRVHLFWDPVTATSGGVPIVGYNIYRATYPNGQTEVPVTDFFVSGMQYTDPNVINGVTYYYVIRAVDRNNNESEPSAEVKVTPSLVEPTFNIEDGQITRKQYLEITGQAEPNSSVVINGLPVPLNPDGTFSHGVMLKNGINAIDIIVVDPTTDPILNPTPDHTYSLRFNINFATVTTIIMTIGFKDATINGQYVRNAMPVPPTIINGSSMVPFRFLGESLGAKISWDPNAYKVTYELEGNKIEMWIGQTVAKVNGQSVKINPKPQIISGSTVVPVRFIIENLGAEVEWYGATKTILVRYPKS